MHLYFITRGIKHERDRWVREMQSQFFPYEMKDLVTGQTKAMMAQGALRPVEFWEYVFPETSKYGELEVDNMHLMMNSLNLSGRHASDPKLPFLDKYSWMIRKALHLNKIPDVIPVTITKPMSPPGITIWPIGWRKDEMGVLEQSPNIEQEKL